MVYTTKVYKSDPDILNIDDGGSIEVAEGGSIVLPSGRNLGEKGVPSLVEWIDDFLGDVIDDSYSAAKGSDGQGVIATITQAACGVVRLTAADEGSSDAANLSVLTHGLNWKANQGNLTLVTRFKLESAANVAFFIGFTDVLATTTLEAPFTLATTSYTSNASDACGILYDTAATTDTIRAVGVAADTDATHVDTSLVPDTSWHTLRIHVGSTGTMTVYYDGTLVATVAAAVTATVALTPVVAITGRTTTTKYIDVDYLAVRATRA